MKSKRAIPFILSITACLIISSTLDTGTIQKDKFFDEATGKIVYELSGTQSGSETLIWIDHGDKIKRETASQIKVMGFEQSENTTLFTIKNEVYNVDPVKMTGTHIKNDFMGDASTEQKKEFGKELIEAWHGKKIGTEVIAGKTCEVWDIPDMFTKIWLWKGLTLKSETNMMGFIQVSTAKSVEVGINVPSSTFDISKYEIKEMGNVQDYMNKY